MKPFAGRYMAWSVDEADYPVQGTSVEQLRFLLHYAILAPSSRNAQPWSFRIVEDAIELLADPRRALPVCDPDDRQLIMSCGAALRHLEIACRRFGHTPEVVPFPDAGRSERIALVRRGDPRDPTQEDLAMLRSIPKRRTNRAPFEHRPLPEELVTALVEAAHADGAWLAIVEGEIKWQLAALIAEADRLQSQDARFRQELAAWLRPPRSPRRDGMPMSAVALKGPVSWVGPLFVRTFDTGLGRAATDRQLAGGSPVLAVLGTSSDAPPAWLQAGRSLAGLLLRACSQGVSASFLGQPVEIPRLRARIGGLLDREGFPQLILRLGYGPDVHPTPRRSLEEVLSGA